MENTVSVAPEEEVSVFGPDDLKLVDLEKGFWENNKECALPSDILVEIKGRVCAAIDESVCDYYKLRDEIKKILGWLLFFNSNEKNRKLCDEIISKNEGMEVPHYLQIMAQGFSGMGNKIIAEKFYKINVKKYYELAEEAYLREEKGTLADGENNDLQELMVTENLDKLCAIRFHRFANFLAAGEFAKASEILEDLKDFLLPVISERICTAVSAILEGERSCDTF